MSVLRRPDPSEAPPHWRPTPLAALGQARTPTEQHFVRDHFPEPVRRASWALDVAGVSLDLAALAALPQRELTVLLECAGHRRTEFVSSPAGLPWGVGAVAQAAWGGVSLATVLALAGIPAGTCEVVLEGADAGAVPGRAGVHRFARSLPLDKALDPDVLLATACNGEPIAAQRGGPVRAIVPGWYATDSVKWLERVSFCAGEFDGYFQAEDYRLLAPGDTGRGARMSDMAIHALILSPDPQAGAITAGPRTVEGIAWGGAGGVAQVGLRVDLGEWVPARLRSPAGPYAATPWEADVELAPGRHELSCRALDCAGNAQPLQPVENVRGYANHAVHRVRLTAR